MTKDSPIQEPVTQVSISGKETLSRMLFTSMVKDLLDLSHGKLVNSTQVVEMEESALLAPNQWNVRELLISDGYQEPSMLWITTYL